MKYYRDIDYFLYFEDFPHMGIPGIIISNTDGTANIYINTLYSRERQAETIRHELRHFANGHLYDDVMTLEEKELDADFIEGSDCVFGENFSFVERNASYETYQEKIRSASRATAGRIYSFVRT